MTQQTFSLTDSRAARGEPLHASIGLSLQGFFTENRTFVAIDLDDTLIETESHYRSLDAALTVLIADFAGVPHQRVKELHQQAEPDFVTGFGFGPARLFHLWTAITLAAAHEGLTYTGPGAFPQTPAERRGALLDRVENFVRATLSKAINHFLYDLPFTVKPGAVELLHFVTMSDFYIPAIVTKGDTVYQTLKIRELLKAIEFPETLSVRLAVYIVPDKTPQTYRALAHKRGFRSPTGGNGLPGFMIGDSVASDIVPAQMHRKFEAFHVLGGTTWGHEQVHEPQEFSRPALGSGSLIDALNVLRQRAGLVEEMDD